MSDQNIRVRFAPSPTGPLHIGGVRTALYNYLFAKKNKGTFIIRIEDTDQTRFVPGAEKYILDSLAWCGIVHDEGPRVGGNFGPYVQSERKAMYLPYAEELVKNGKAYYAFDTAEELDFAREDAKQNGNAAWQYDSRTRMSMKNSLSLGQDEVKQKLENGTSYVIRMKIEAERELSFEDIIRGKVTVNTSNLDDKVLFKSDGMPTYHLANIVDDHLMEISHVIRGEEWLPSAPLHILLYEALGWDAPQFAHLPLLLKPDGNGKLSKRDGDRLGFPVFPCNWTTEENEIFPGYKETGYFADGFINMLAFLGWNPGTEQEIFSMEELIENFSLERVSKSGAKFDPDKTKWFQQQYLRAKSNEELATELKKLVSSEIPQEKLIALCGFMKERITFVHEIVTEADYLLDEISSFDDVSLEKKWNENSSSILNEFNLELQKVEPFKKIEIENCFKNFIESKNLGIGTVMPIFRLALTGKGKGPDMFEIAEFLGKEDVSKRILSSSYKIETLKNKA